MKKCYPEKLTQGRYEDCLETRRLQRKGKMSRTNSVAKERANAEDKERRQGRED